jgi:hypothetical protein
LLFKMTSIFTPGEIVPISGLYRVVHHQVHESEHEVTCLRGEKFPPCKGCGQNPRFTLVRSAIHILDSEHFQCRTSPAETSGVVSLRPATRRRAPDLSVASRS